MARMPADSRGFGLALGSGAGFRLEAKMAQDKTTGAAVPADIAGLSFEDALAELQDLVKRLERGDNKLDDAIKAYERGAALKRHCEAKLREAQLKVEKIVLSQDGSVGVEPAKLD
jgi:exodeoxyribonuclease VII small subunit